MGDVGTRVAREAKARTGEAARSRPIGWLGRVGLVAQGVSYALVAVLALRLALGEGGAATDREGALERLAGEPLGRVVLVLLALGFAANAVWRFSEALFDRGGKGDDAQGLGKRAAQLGRGLVCTVLAVVAASIVLGSRSGGGSEEKQATAGVLDWPGGRWLVGLAGVVVAAVGLWNGYRAVTEKFKEELETWQMSAGGERWTSGVARVGRLARMVVFGTIGWFLGKAALDFDPNQAVGLDGALARLARASYGSWLLGLTAAGLFAYGVFSALEARYRKV